MLKFIFSRTFLINAFIAVALIGILILAVFKFIDRYTLHGETVSVPNLEGLKIEEVEGIVSEKKLRYQILDSVYKENMEKGIVLFQNPLPENLVKKNRTIYITTSKVITPKISMPNLIDMSQRLAIAKLESYGFKMGNLQYIPSECVNCVLKQRIGQKEVNAGDMVEKGSVINLVLGKGTSNERVVVPYLVNSSKEEAIKKLQEFSLNIGAEIYDKCFTKLDSLNAKVYKQFPVKSSKALLTMGSSVDIWLTTDTASIIYAPPIDSVASDSVETTEP